MLFTVKEARYQTKRENRKIILLSESSQHDKATYCIIQPQFWKGKKPWDNEKISVCKLGGWDGGMNQPTRGTERDFQGLKV